VPFLDFAPPLLTVFFGLAGGLELREPDGIDLRKSMSSPSC
jgi:hypothetical protein